MRLRLPHAGQRFVEQHHARVGSEHHRDLELALLAVAERRRGCTAVRSQTRDGQRRCGAIQHRAIRFNTAEHPQR